jgi:predicted aspartyl protease
MDKSTAGFFGTCNLRPNGVGRAEKVLLREIGIERLSIDDAPAVMLANLNGSLLGLSFLSRLKSSEVREGRADD